METILVGMRTLVIGQERTTERNLPKENQIAVESIPQANNSDLFSFTGIESQILELYKFLKVFLN